MMQRLRERKEVQFFTVLPKADPFLAVVWFGILVVRSVLPALLAIFMGLLVRSVQAGETWTVPLFLTGTAFLLLQILTPIHLAVGANLGDRTAAWLRYWSRTGLVQSGWPI